MLERSNDLETSVLVGQIRSTAVDLLQAAGMDSSEAIEALRRASHLVPEEQSASGPQESHPANLLETER